MKMIFHGYKKLFSGVILATICLFLAHTSAFATTYYVATNGFDSVTNGTYANPFKTIQYGLDIVTAGDTIDILGGTYREAALTATADGTPGNPISIRSYSSETVVLKGSSIFTEWTLYQTNIWKSVNPTNTQQVFDDGVLLQKLGWPNGWLMTNNAFWNTNHAAFTTWAPALLGDMFPGSFFVDTNDNDTIYVWLSDNSSPSNSLMEVSTEKQILKASGPGYYFLEGLTFEHSMGLTSGQFDNAAVQLNSNSVVRNCTFQWCDASGLSVAGGALVTNCVFSDLGVNGFGSYAPSAIDGTTNITVQNSTFVRCNSRHMNTAYHAAGIKFGTHRRTDDILIENCQFLDNYAVGLWFDYCTNLYAPAVIRNNLFSGNESFDLFLEVSTNFTVYNNVFVSSGAEYSLYISAANGCKIFNNTFSHTAEGGNGVIGVAGNTGERAPFFLSYNVFTNNFLTVTNGVGTMLTVGGDHHSNTFNNVFDNNHYFRADGDALFVTTALDGTNVVIVQANLAGWTATSGNDASSIEGEPWLMIPDPEIPYPSSDSPLVDAGITLAVVTNDYLETPRPYNGSHDIGGIEYELIDSEASPDGIHDVWETYYFDDLTTATAVSDTDGDGVSDLDEFVRHTDPTTTGSVNVVYYARKSGGSDSYSGLAPVAMSSGLGPKVTINAALTESITGDGVHLFGGVYNEDVDLTAADGDVTIEPGETVYLTSP